MSAPQSRPFSFADQVLDLSVPRIMGILNVTPDSFSDGGRHSSLDQALYRVDVMLNEGADLIDIGGESTRPGAASVSEQEELDRVIPVVEAVTQRFDTIISLDTSTARVIREGASAGAGLVNDVRALQREGAIEAASDTGLPVCLMHMQGQPENMQDNPGYQDLMADLLSFFRKRVECCRAAGIRDDQIMLDPGYGFGKTVAHNYSLIKHLPELQTLGFPLLTGTSRKSMLGAVTGREVDERLSASVVSAALCIERGANIVRVHDVAPTRDALNVAQALLQAE